MEKKRKKIKEGRKRRNEISGYSSTHAQANLRGWITDETQAKKHRTVPEEMMKKSN